MLAVAVAARDTHRMPFGIGDDHGVHAIGLARAAEVFERLAGAVLDDGTVRGGTGWGAEFAKLCNKPLHVFDQEKNAWFSWSGEDWEKRSSTSGPLIAHPHFTGTGTRTIRPNGKRAIDDLFSR